VLTLSRRALSLSRSGPGCEVLTELPRTVFFAVTRRPNHSNRGFPTRKVAHRPPFRSRWPHGPSAPPRAGNPSVRTRPVNGESGPDGRSDAAALGGAA